MNANDPKYQQFYQSLTPEQKARFREILSQRDKQDGAAAARDRIEACDRRSMLCAKMRQMRG